MSPRAWPAADTIESARLTLEPLRVEHAEEMTSVLGGQKLYEYMGGVAPTFEQLRARYERQVKGQSPDGTRGWLNWIVRHRATGAPVGTVQATLRREEAQLVAEVAWTIAAAHQGRGYATEAAAAMAGWLRGRGVGALVAHIAAQHQASIAVARRLGLVATDVSVDGETRWISPTAPAGHPV